MITIDEFLERNKDCIKKGWVCYDEDTGWNIFEDKPQYSSCWEVEIYPKCWSSLEMFDIAPFKGNPEDSLRKVR